MADADDEGGAVTAEADEPTAGGMSTAGAEQPRVPVMLVDGDFASLDYMTRALMQAGYDPQSFSDLEAASGAWARLSARPLIGIILLDARAVDPLGDAPDLAELRRRSPVRHALQILLCGVAVDLERLLPRTRPDITDVLPKPIERQTLLLAIQEAKRRHDAAINRRAAGVAEPSHRPPAQRREPPAELRILQWLRDVDEQRQRSLGGVLEPDATWNMLSELLRARITKRRISVTSLCLASRVPVTSALRRIDRLLVEGLITYALDPTDRRRKYVELTTDGANRVQGAVRALVQHSPGGGPPAT